VYYLSDTAPQSGFITLQQTLNNLFNAFSKRELDSFNRAAETIVSCQQQAAESNNNIISKLLAGKKFNQWDHYPKGDAYDPKTMSLYYYHAHNPEDRAEDKGEHGHFHVFIDSDTTPEGKKLDKDETVDHHIIGISMDFYGIPYKLFTTNRWVTNECICPAPRLTKLLENFSVNNQTTDVLVNKWITNMILLFRPQIIHLLTERDKVIDSWKKKYPEKDIFEDRKLEIVSSIDISLEQQVLDIDEASNIYTRSHKQCQT
jgi:uncharacterized protein DUF6969